jgi:transcriptional regulator with XRE-family HTH domain
VKDSSETTPLLATPTHIRMAELIRAEMARQNCTQALLAKAVGRSPKHVNQVLNGKASTHELDYWAHILGVRFVISLAGVER